MDDVYMPPRPVNPYADDQCQPHGGCTPPPPPPPGFDWPMTPPPPPPPKPPKPDHFCNQPGPGLQQIPTIPKVEEGQSLYEAMNTSISRVNACINMWNYISRNCYEAMNACVNAARSNDVYYDDCEVHYQDGFDENEGCAYAIVEKKVVDRNGKPIFVKLVPAYNNTTNSAVTQDIFDVSFIESANLIITAVPTQQNKLGWVGPAMYKGAPIPGGEAVEGNYVYGFNRQGWLKFFPANTTDETILCQNGMVDVIGSCWPILSNNELTPEAQTLTTKASIQAIGFNKGTGSVFFFSCSAQDQPGMTGISVAKVLQGFGCTTAVITAMIDGTVKSEAAGMLYMGQMTTVPQGGLSPDNLAYWVISKRPGFKNRFQKEIADLVQTTGQNAWKNYLLGVQIQDFDDRITANAEAIKAETDRAVQAETWLQENINKEVNRAMQAEAWLQENINKEVDRATAAEKAETDRATAAEAELRQQIIDETNRATAAENANAAAIAAEKLRAITRENEIQAALDKEVRERISADNDIINAIEQEVLARRAADTELGNRIDAVRNELKVDINNLQNTINGITGGTTNLPYLKLTGGTLSGPVNFSSPDTITLGRGPTTDLEAATKKYVDDAVAAGGGGGTGGDVSKEYVDEQVANLQSQLEGKVSKTGDTMSGNLNMDNLEIQNAILAAATGTKVENGAGGPGKIYNLADPVNPTDAVNLQSMTDAIDTAKSDLSGSFLPLAGGEMTGDINMTDNSSIKFYDAAAITADLAKAAITPASTAVNIRPSAAAKRLGITAELIAQARDAGVPVTMATNKDILTALDVSPNDLTGQTYRGKITNDTDDIVVESDKGSVVIKGLDVMMQDQAGSDIPVHGVSEIGPVGEASIKFNPLSTDIMGPVNITNAAGDPTAELSAGTINVGGIELEPHAMDGQPEHLDINVPTSTGEVYINRADDTGQPVTGGTGDLHVTQIESPQQLVLTPATSVSLSGKQIKNLADPTDDQDAVTLKMIKNTQFGNNVPMVGYSEIYSGNLTFRGTSNTKIIDIPINGATLTISIRNYQSDASATVNVTIAWVNGYIEIFLKATSISSNNRLYINFQMNKSDPEIGYGYGLITNQSFRDGHTTSEIENVITDSYRNGILLIGLSSYNYGTATFGFSCPWYIYNPNFISTTGGVG